MRQGAGSCVIKDLNGRDVMLRANSRYSNSLFALFGLERPHKNLLEGSCAAQTLD